jgi:hypothetical protein
MVQIFSEPLGEALPGRMGDVIPPQEEPWRTASKHMDVETVIESPDAQESPNRPYSRCDVC